MQRLRLQEAADTQTVYDLRKTPPALSWIAQTYATPGALVSAVPVLERTLREEMGRAAHDPSIDAQGRVFYTMSVLENAMALAGTAHERVRALLEGARDAFSDPGFRHLATCRLAGAARHAGDVRAAEAWLAQCDPAPSDLALDTAFRIARAGVLLRTGALAEVLVTLGARRTDVPLSLSWKPAAQLLRVHALESLGMQAEADAEYAEATGWQGAATWLPAMIAANRDLGDLCARTVMRWNAAHPEGAAAAETRGVAHALQGQRRKRAVLILVLVAVLAVLAWRLIACATATNGS